MHVRRVVPFGTCSRAILLLSGVLVQLSGVNCAEDGHVFYIQHSGTLKCLTLASDSRTIRTDTECASWDQQKWLYKLPHKQLVSVAHPDICIETGKGDLDWQAVECSVHSEAQQFISPATLDTSLNPHVFASSRGTPSGAYNIISAAGLLTVKPSVCVYPKISAEARNSDFEFADTSLDKQYGFEAGDQINWKCQLGYRTPQKHTERLSTCLAGGTWSDLDPLNCVRVQCPAPVVVEDKNDRDLNQTSTSGDTLANVYRLIDNNLEQITADDLPGGEGNTNPVYFFFDDEIVYRCPDTHINVASGTNNPVSSLCTADGTWSVPQLTCTGMCDQTITIPADQSACGRWVTPGFPTSTYGSQQECFYKIVAEDPDMRFKIRVEFMELEFRSYFSTACTNVDRIKFTSYTDDFKKEELHAFIDEESEGLKLDEICGNSEILSWGGSGLSSFQKPVSIEACAQDDGCLVCDHMRKYMQPKTLTTTTNQFLIRFWSDRDTRKAGGGLTWWTENETKTNRSHPDCRWKFDDYDKNKLCEKLKPNFDGSQGKLVDVATSYNDDQQYGRYSDWYHLLYVVLMFIIILITTYRISTWLYRCATCKNRVDKSEDDDSDADDDSDYSDSDSEYDLNEEEDDVDDFSLLTLLEMKANRVELGSAVDKLTKEIDALDNAEHENRMDAFRPTTGNTTDNSATSFKPPQDLAGGLMTHQMSTGRRMSNVNKVHAK